MEITLEKIELVKDRTGVTYKEAKDALEKAGGSVVDAIIAIEEGVNAFEDCKESNVAADLFTRIKELVKKGNVTKICVKKDDQTIVNIPLNAGVVGVLLAPWGMLAGVIAAFGTKCKVEVTTVDGEVVNLNSKVKVAANFAKEKGEIAWNYAKEKAPEAWNYAKEQGEKAWNFAREKAPSAWDYAKEQSEKALNFAKEKAPEAWDYAKEQGGKAWNFAKEKAPEAWDAAVEKGEEVWEFAKTLGEDTVESAKDKSTEAWDFAKEKLEERKSERNSKLFDAIDISESAGSLGKEDEK